MNPFASDKAPYAIALLISAIGWAFATLHGGMQDSLVATYAVDRKGSAVVGTLTNLSKTKPIGPVSFMLACAEPRECLADDGALTRFAIVAPTGISSETNEFSNPNGHSVEFTVALPPGGAIQIVSQTSNNDPVLLLMTPNGVKPEALYLLPQSHPVAWFIHRYYFIVLTMSALLLAAFIAWLVHGLLFSKPEPQGT